MEPIVCTPEHPFYILNAEGITIVDFEGRDSNDYQGQWVTAGNLKVGHKVLLSNGKNGIINSVETEELDEPVDTYNFEVQDYHTYYVGSEGILVHNACQVTAPNGKTLYRGGNDLFENLADDLTIIDDMVQPGGGPSLNTDLKFATRISRGRGAYTLDHIPKGLDLAQTGSKGHYVLQALEPMAKNQYLELLRSITLTAV